MPEDGRGRRMPKAGGRTTDAEPSVSRMHLRRGRRDSVRIVATSILEELYRLVLDIIYLALTLALFTLVAFIAKGVERL